MNSYTCPMHPEIVSDQPGTCPKCGMRLVLQSDLRNNPEKAVAEHSEKKPWIQTYWPLMVIIGMIFLVTAVLSLKAVWVGNFSWKETMANFMAGFFLVFASFKLLDLKGFAEGYSTYDLLARKFFQYGFVYPFIELGLGLAYLTRFELFWTNIITVLILGFSGFGVVQSLMKKRKIQCVCLGTIIKVPLTHVTLVEDFGMAFMALLMLLF